MAEVVYANFNRREEPDKSQALLTATADYSLADGLRSYGEMICKHLDETKRPLMPEHRRRLLEAIGVLQGHPRGVE